MGDRILIHPERFYSAAHRLAARHARRRGAAGEPCRRHRKRRADRLPQAADRDRRPRQRIRRFPAPRLPAFIACAPARTPTRSGPTGRTPSGRSWSAAASSGSRSRRRLSAWARRDHRRSRRGDHAPALCAACCRHSLRATRPIRGVQIVLGDSVAAFEGEDRVRAGVGAAGAALAVRHGGAWHRHPARDRVPCLERARAR